MPFFYLDKDHALGRRYLETFSTPDVAANEHVVNPHHIIPRSCEFRLLLFVQASWKFFLLCPLQPANIIVLPLTAVGTGKIRFLYLLTLVEDIALVHT